MRVHLRFAPHLDRAFVNQIGFVLRIIAFGENHITGLERFVRQIGDLLLIPSESGGSLKIGARHSIVGASESVASSSSSESPSVATIHSTSVSDKTHAPSNLILLMPMAVAPCTDFATACLIARFKPSSE
jgi:hypothetical protein